MKMKNGSQIIKQGSGEPVRGQHPMTPQHSPEPFCTDNSCSCEAPKIDAEKEIIRLRNEHAELVALLKECRDVVDSVAGACGVSEEERRRDMVLRVEQALSKARAVKA